MLRLLFVCASFPTALALMALLLRLILFVYKTSKLCNVLRMIFLTVDSPTYVNKNEMLQESYAKSWKSKEVMCNKRGSVHSAVDCDRLLLMMLKMNIHFDLLPVYFIISSQNFTHPSILFIPGIEKSNVQMSG